MSEVPNMVARVGDQVYKQSRWILVVIGALHVALGIAAGFLLYFQYSALSEKDVTGDMLDTLTNAGLFGFIGSILYFSRKVYAYLITDKFGRVIEERGAADRSEGGNVRSMDVEQFKTITIGYYVYLTTRPLAGLMIGPMMMLLVLAGLMTFGEVGTNGAVGLSTAGVNLIYVVAFVGGYSSSDLFDYFSKLGGRLIKRIEIP